MVSIKHGKLVKSILFLIPVLIHCSNPDIRQPAVAGSFYPDSAVKLKYAIDYFVASAQKPVDARPLGLIVPHAGLIYSGQIATDAFVAAAGQQYDAIVFLGTNHTSRKQNGFALSKTDYWATPLGKVIIDQGFNDDLVKNIDGVMFDDEAHLKEHSIEIHLPIVLNLFPETPIVPIIVLTQNLSQCRTFGNQLADQLAGKNILLVASTDLSHYPSYTNAISADHSLIKAIESLDCTRLEKELNDPRFYQLPQLDTRACGSAPLMVLTAYMNRRGANCAKIISYANSGDVAVGNHQRVVGYTAIACYQEKIMQEKETKSREIQSDFISSDNQKYLLQLARQTIETFLHGNVLPVPRNYSPILEKHQGAFVTLHKKGVLRGCIGHMVEDQTIPSVVSAMAFQAAFRDWRFQPVTEDELGELEIEISILTPFRQVAGYKDIIIGRDGIIIKKEGRSAVFLPHVAIEQGWNRDQTLTQLCKKAGLAANAWKSGTEFYTFQAQVFSENELLD